jgi:hypothetical protein
MRCKTLKVWVSNRPYRLTALHSTAKLTLLVQVAIVLATLSASNVNAQTTYSVAVNIQGLPANLSTTVSVDGAFNGTMTGGQSRSFAFQAGTGTHVITVDFYVPSSGGSNGTRYYENYTSWGFNSEGSHTFNYAAQYYLTIATSFSTARGEGWYNSGSSAQAVLDGGQIDASSGVRNIFTGWSGEASGTRLASNPILMDSPKKAIANWNTQFLLTVNSEQNVSGLVGSGWYDQGSHATFSAPALVPADNSSRLRFDHWSGDYDGSASSGNITMDRPKLIQAHYLAQYLLTIQYSPDTVPHTYNSSWYDANTNVPLGPALSIVELSSVERLRFVGWLENGQSLTDVSINVYMDRPHELTLDYKTQYYLDVQSTYGPVAGSGWYDKGSTARITAPTTAGQWPLTYSLTDWQVNPTATLNADNASWTLTVDKPYVVDAVWSFDVFPIIGLAAGVVLAIGVIVIGVVIAHRRGIFIGPSMRPATSVPTAMPGTQVCRTCGNKIPMGAVFCQRCGTPVSAPQRATLEDRVYDYIVKHDGVISLSKASKDLGVSVDKLKEATESLKKEGRLA